MKLWTSLHKQIVKDANGNFKFNLHLAVFNPYSTNKQAVLDLLDGILHNLGASILFPDKHEKNTAVETSTEELYHNLIESIPYAIKNKLNNLDRPNHISLATRTSVKSYHSPTADLWLRSIL